MIQPVILAGGSGTRLWPASRRHHPKQLLALTGDLTLLQETAVRLRDFRATPVNPDPIVVTSDEYRFLVADQLKTVGLTGARIVLEPIGRNTAPALTLAALMASRDSADPVLLVMPSDQLITDIPVFHAAVAEGAEQADAGRVVTFGVVPDRPETGFGYIHLGEAIPGAATARSLAGFVEKPDAATAEQYMAAGDYLWNSGIFMVKASVWLNALSRCQPAICESCREALADQDGRAAVVLVDAEAFAACPSDSIDYAVMEKLGGAKDSTAAGATGGGATGGGTTGDAAPEAPDLDVEAAVVPLEAGWSDVGGWAALWTVSPKDEAGNATRGEVILKDTRDSLVHSGSRLVTVLGADEMVVVETADAVLVAPKNRVADLKQLVEAVQAHDEDLTVLHRRVYRPWGFYESLDSGERFQVKRIMVSPGASLSLQYHTKRAEHWVVVSGVAEVTCGDDVRRLEEDESTYIPIGAPHRLANPGSEPLEIIEVQSGEYLGEDDIVRLQDDYGR